MKHDDYTVRWICALATEMAVPRTMLDERHDSLPQDRRDHNSYVLGRIGPHNVVIACLPEGVMGVTSAAPVAEQMFWTFKALRFGLMVSIGRGVPSAENDLASLRWTAYDGLEHFTWANFTITMSTGGMALLLGSQPHTFRGLLHGHPHHVASRRTRSCYCIIRCRLACLLGDDIVARSMVDLRSRVGRNRTQLMPRLHNAEVFEKRFQRQSHRDLVHVFVLYHKIWFYLRRSYQ